MELWTHSLLRVMSARAAGSILQGMCQNSSPRCDELGTVIHPEDEGMVRAGMSQQGSNDARNSLQHDSNPHHLMSDAGLNDQITAIVGVW